MRNFKKWFKQNMSTIPTWYSNPYDEKALEQAYNAGYEEALKTMKKDKENDSK